MKPRPALRSRVPTSKSRYIGTLNRTRCSPSSESDASHSRFASRFSFWKTVLSPMTSDQRGVGPSYLRRDRKCCQGPFFYCWHPTQSRWTRGTGADHASNFHQFSHPGVSSSQLGTEAGLCEMANSTAKQGR